MLYRNRKPRDRSLLHPRILQLKNKKEPKGKKKVPANQGKSKKQRTFSSSIVLGKPMAEESLLLSQQPGGMAAEVSS